MTSGKLLILITLFVLPFSATAREAVLIDFDLADRAVTLRNHINRVEAEMRNTWESAGPPETKARHPDDGGWSLNKSNSCFSNGYFPVWWLKPDVQLRRAYYYDAIEKIACEVGVPTTMLDATILQESAYNPWARSRAGAIGMMQLMPETARSLGLGNPWHPTENIMAGARYLRQQLDRFGRFDLALAAYNAGPERRSLSTGSIPPIPETVRYVRAITSNWARMTQVQQNHKNLQKLSLPSIDAERRSGSHAVVSVTYDVPSPRGAGFAVRP